MTKNAVLGGGAATMAIVRVALIRMLRGKSLWVVVGMSLLPLVFALLLRERQSGVDHWRAIITFWAYFQAILPPVLLGSAIGEEIEERTMTYLWSRPLPRWSIVAGKLVALVPVLWVILTISVILPFYATMPDPGAHTDLLYRSIGAVILGTTATAAITTGLTTLAPRAGTVLSLGFLVFIDRSLAWFELSISKLSVTYHGLRLSGTFQDTESAAAAVLWLIALSAVWLLIAAFQIRRIE